MSIRTKIVGVTFQNDDGSNRQDILSYLRPGDTLTLCDMSSARFPEAIGVFDAYGQQCGNISKQLALDLRARYAGWEQYPVTVLQVTGGGAENLGCNIQIGAPSFDERVAAIDADVERIETEYHAKASAAAYSAPRRNSNGQFVRQPRKPRISSRSKWVALILCVILGYFGAHCFYLGKKGKGILYLCTFGVCGFGWLLDCFLIAIGKAKDARGLPVVR